MIPWELIDRAPVPGDGGELTLHRRGEEFSIRADGEELMNSRVHGSEEVLAELACDRISERRGASVLVGGLGLGFTTAAALRQLAHDARVIVAELVPAVVAWNRGTLAHLADYPLGDPRVTVHVEDGRFFLQTTRRRFDLITGEPPPPKLAGIVNLYTRDYFQLLHDRLTEGGMVTYWLPGHSLSEADAQVITRAFLEVFEDATLWQGWGLNMMLVGTRGGERAPVSEAWFRRAADAGHTRAMVRLALILKHPDRVRSQKSITPVFMLLFGSNS